MSSSAATRDIVAEGDGDAREGVAVARAAAEWADRRAAGVGPAESIEGTIGNGSRIRREGSREERRGVGSRRHPRGDYGVDTTGMGDAFLYQVRAAIVRAAAASRPTVSSAFVTRAEWQYNVSC